jgi:hypothetical protein
MRFRDDDVHGRLLFLEAKEAERDNSASTTERVYAFLRHLFANYEGMAAVVFDDMRPVFEEAAKTDPDMRARLDKVDAERRQRDIREARKQNIKVIQ